MASFKNIFLKLSLRGIEKNLENYKSGWDAVIINDSDMIYVNEFIKNIK